MTTEHKQPTTAGVQIPDSVLFTPNPDALLMLNPGLLQPHSIKQLASEFASSLPYPHVCIPNFFRQEVIEMILQHFPPNDSGVWHRYWNPIEVKLACNILSRLPKQIGDVILGLNSPDFVRWVGEVTGIPNLEADPYLHGGGLHSHPRGGKLDMHLDYSIHPLTGKERRVNLIVYMNNDWKPDYCGAIELWDRDFSHCVKKILPCFNQAILFQTSDLSYHGLPDPIECPPQQSRRSLALYYVTNPRVDVLLRPKAQFFGRPTDPASSFLNQLRQIRVERRLEPKDLEGWTEECHRLCKLGMKLPDLSGTQEDL